MLLCPALCLGFWGLKHKSSCLQGAHFGSTATSLTEVLFVCFVFFLLFFVFDGAVICEPSPQLPSSI